MTKESLMLKTRSLSAYLKHSVTDLALKDLL